MPGTRSSGPVQKNPAQGAEGMLLVSILSKQMGSMCIYFKYFLFGSNRLKGVKATGVGLNLKSLLSGPAFSMENPMCLKPDPFLFPPLSLYWVPNHCSVSLLKVENSVAGAKACGCVCLRLRLLSDLRQLAEEILFQSSEPWVKGCQQFFPPTC